LKTLFLVNSPPYPPTSGAPMRSWQLINILATRGPVHVISFGSREPGDCTMPIVAEWTHIDSSEFASSSGSVSRLIGVFRSGQYPVPAAATAAVNERVRQAMERVRPDLVVLSHWKNALPSAVKDFEPIALDMHNVESLLASEYAHIRSRRFSRFILWRWRRRESNLVRKASRTWVCGQNDVDELKRLDPRLPSPVVWPNGIDVSRYEECLTPNGSIPPGLQRNGATIIYIGLFSHEPNRAAAEELIEGIFPRVTARIPHARLLLVGDCASERMAMAAKSDSRVVVTGKVDDVRPYLSLADIALVPLRKGGGTRLKILECFAAGVPVVSSSKGAEGIEVVDGREIRIADDPGRMADLTIELLLDSRARRAQVDDAYALVEGTYSWTALARQLDDVLPEALRARVMT
jgi:polysaccharide biosynthesis protein PslH